MKRWVLLLTAVLLLVAGGVSYYYLFLRKGDSNNNGGSSGNGEELKVTEGKMDLFVLRDEEIEVALVDDSSEIRLVRIKFGAAVSIFASSDSDEAESQLVIASEDDLTELVQAMAESEWVKIESNGEQKVSVFKIR